MQIWQHRINLEYRCYDASTFITLTYRDELPNMELVPSDLTLFIKRLRKYVQPKKIRYFAVGEYGSENCRPHYHIIVFGLGCLDHDSLEKMWGHGFVHQGEVNQKSIRYICKYVVKAMVYQKDPRLEGRHPEFMRSSKQDGGIGMPAIKKIHEKFKNNKYVDIGEIMDHLKIGKKDVLLGRYLTKKLAELMSVDQDRFERRLWDYQDKLIQMHLNQKTWFYQNLLDETEGKRAQQENRIKIFKQRKRI